MWDWLSLQQNDPVSKDPSIRKPSKVLRLQPQYRPQFSRCTPAARPSTREQENTTLTLSRVKALLTESSSSLQHYRNCTLSLHETVRHLRQERDERPLPQELDAMRSSFQREQSAHHELINQWSILQRDYVDEQNTRRSLVDRVKSLEFNRIELVRAVQHADIQCKTAQEALMCATERAKIAERKLALDAEEMNRVENFVDRVVRSTSQPRRPSSESPARQNVATDMCQRCLTRKNESRSLRSQVVAALESSRALQIDVQSLQATLHQQAHLLRQKDADIARLKQQQQRSLSLTHNTDKNQCVTNNAVVVDDGKQRPPFAPPPPSPIIIDTRPHSSTSE